ncbi:MAG: hypothetical protein SGILL_007302, partial [Bacillariaceae sp.]
MDHKVERAQSMAPQRRRRSPGKIRNSYGSFVIGLCLWSVEILAFGASTTRAFSASGFQSTPRGPPSTLKATEISSSSDVSSSITAKSDGNSPSRKVALLLCPAQFCVPQDYQELWKALPDKIEHGSDEIITVDRDLSRVAPLSRRDWIKVSKQLPTMDFLNANLSVHKTLNWYFDAIEEGISEILYQNGSRDVDICLVGHSIGGWVARAYLGGLSR